MITHANLKDITVVNKRLRALSPCLGVFDLTWFRFTWWPGYLNVQASRIDSDGTVGTHEFNFHTALFSLSDFPRKELKRGWRKPNMLTVVYTLVRTRNKDIVRLISWEIWRLGCSLKGEDFNIFTNLMKIYRNNIPIKGYMYAGGTTFKRKK